MLAATPNTERGRRDRRRHRAVPLGAGRPIRSIGSCCSRRGATSRRTRRCSRRSRAKLTRVYVLDLDNIADPLTQVGLRADRARQAGARRRAGARPRPRDARPRRQPHRARPARHGHRVDVAAARRRQARHLRLLARRLAPDRRDRRASRASASSRSTTCTRPTSGSTTRRSRVLSTQNGKIFVDHGDPLGHATIIPSTDGDPRRRGRARRASSPSTSSTRSPEPCALTSQLSPCSRSPSRRPPRRSRARTATTRSRSARTTGRCTRRRRTR